MLDVRRSASWLGAAGATALLLLLGSCRPNDPTAAHPALDASLAKGGPSGALAVASTSPPAAPQDTVLDVHVFGSGFVRGATSVWSLNGDTTKVHVNSTRYVSSGELVANITVPLGAPVASYDVVVALADGKKGIGAEMFAVTPGDSRSDWYFARTLSDGITLTKLYGDGRNLDGTPVANPAIDSSGYAGQQSCAARGRVEWYSAPTRATGNAFIAPGGGTTPYCQNLERKLTADTGAVSVASLRWTATIKQVMQLAVGDSRLQNMMFGPVVEIPKCARIIFSDSTVGSGVRVTRLLGDSNHNSGEWMVESQGTHLAGCYNFVKGTNLGHTGPDYYLPFRLRIVERSP
jgi:hypothetical protein